jgi:hypothetical protein
MKDYLEVLECDECGFTAGVESEHAGEVLGWRFTAEGTKCPMCAVLATEPDERLEEVEEPAELLGVRVTTRFCGEKFVPVGYADFEFLICDLPFGHDGEHLDVNAKVSF